MKKKRTVQFPLKIIFYPQNLKPFLHIIQSQHSIPAGFPNGYPVRSWVTSYPGIQQYHICARTAIPSSPIKPHWSFVLLSCLGICSADSVGKPSAATPTWALCSYPLQRYSWNILGNHWSILIIWKYTSIQQRLYSTVFTLSSSNIFLCNQFTLKGDILNVTFRPFQDRYSHVLLCGIVLPKASHSVHGLYMLTRNCSMESFHIGNSPT